MSEILEEIQYHGHVIRSGYNGAEPGFSSHSCFIYREGTHQFTIVVKMSVLLAMTEYKGKDVERKALLQTVALSHSKGRIDLQDFKPEMIYEVVIGAPRKARAKEELRAKLLEALGNIRSLCPQDFRRQGLNLSALQEFLNVTADEIARELNDLYDEGLVQVEGDPTDRLADGLAWISPKGMTGQLDDRVESESQQVSISDMSFEYDVALSFAGEQRPLAEALAEGLKREGLRVFYDGFEQASLWGENLYDHLHDVYFQKARYCLLIASNDYASKVWTNHERQSAQARALNEKGAYILPLRVDDTEIPGLRPTVSYVDTREKSVEAIVELVVEKVRREAAAPQSTSLGQDWTQLPAHKSSSFLADGDIVHRGPTGSFGDGPDEEVSWVNDRQGFIRLVPASPLELTRREADEFTRRLFPMGKGIMQYHIGRNRHGGCVYHRLEGEMRAVMLTQLFLTGEMWGIHQPCFVGRDYLKMGTLQELYRVSLEMMANAAAAIGLEFPVQITVGASGLEGMSLGIASQTVEGSCVDDEVISSASLKSADEGMTPFAVELLKRFCDSAGARYPWETDPDWD